jgi:hypothetical protein
MGVLLTALEPEKYREVTRNWNHSAVIRTFNREPSEKQSDPDELYGEVVAVMWAEGAATYLWQIRQGVRRLIVCYSALRISCHKWNQMSEARMNNFEGIDFSMEWNGWNRMFRLLDERRQITMLAGSSEQHPRMWEASRKMVAELIERAE